ncbi:xanthine dehydrogenase accessory protein XdhC [Rahnella sp. SAP-1]|uniref:Xanthine dehydrogenase accessory protein XdhC n=1 Tax=Rouxiella aceris TaxID=2703884 RepID=A0A848MR12_9GAMM|nr:xanthine dehydrogenase accessory protein XdhC [Rouxiella aceris]NMP29743.1 xanthine dehydrogenase accessory protein XdhC [Rouxiella aceris]
MRNDEWISQLAQLHQQRTSCVLLTLVEHQGSTPRNSGCKMVVTADQQYFTLGGGNLEYQAIAIAREMLQAQAQQSRLERFNLGARLGQCCGGVATVLLEPLCQQQPVVVVYGAGHVGRALIAILATLPCRIYWVDSRASAFPPQVDPQISCISDEDPAATVQQMPAGSYFMVLTHDHQLDLLLSEKILRRNDFSYFGLIGSLTKRKRFEYRLAGKGIPQGTLDKMRCPVGLPDVKGKLPAEIAVAIAGEFIAAYGSDPNPL